MQRIELIIDPFAIMLGITIVVIAYASLRHITAPPKIKVFFHNPGTIREARIADSHITIIRFHVWAVFINSGGTTGAIVDIYPRITHPVLQLDEGDRHENNSYWYVLPGMPTKTPIPGQTLAGHGTFPIMIEIRLFFDNEDEARATLGSKREVEVTVDYKWSSTKKGGHFVNETKPIRFALSS